MAKRKIAVAGVALLLLIASTVVASAAFNTVTIQRDATIDVVQDDQGPLSLTDGTSGNVVGYASNGELTVDFTNPSNSSGINPNSQYTLGDSANPTTTYAFTITNTDSQNHTVDISFAFSGSDPASSTENVQFEVYDSQGMSTGTVSESNSLTGTDLSSGETLYVVVSINAMDVSQSNSLSGTLTIKGGA